MNYEPREAPGPPAPSASSAPRPGAARRSPQGPADPSRPNPPRADEEPPPGNPGAATGQPFAQNPDEAETAVIHTDTAATIQFNPGFDDPDMNATVQFPIVTPGPGQAQPNAVPVQPFGTDRPLPEQGRPAPQGRDPQPPQSDPRPAPGSEARNASEDPTLPSGITPGNPSGHGRHDDGPGAPDTPQPEGPYREDPPPNGSFFAPRSPDTPDFPDTPGPADVTMTPGAPHYAAGPTPQSSDYRDTEFPEGGPMSRRFEATQESQPEAPREARAEGPGQQPVTRQPEPGGRAPQGHDPREEGPTPPPAAPPPSVKTVPPAPEMPPSSPTPPHTTDEEYEEREALLARVREIAGVRDAYYVTAQDGSPSLRLDLEEGVDPAQIQDQVSAVVAEQLPPEDEEPEPPRAPEPEPRAEPVSEPPAARREDPEEEAEAEAPSEPPARRARRAPEPIPAQAQEAADVSPPRKKDEAALPQTEPMPPAHAEGRDSGPVPPTPAAPRLSRSHRASRSFDEALPPVPAFEGSPVTPRDSERAAVPVELQRLTVNSEEFEAAVHVDVTVGGEEVQGSAVSAAADWHIQRAAASATLEALRPWAVPPSARVEVEHVSIVATAPVETALVTFLWLDAEGQQRFAGASVVQGEQLRAVVRAAVGALTEKMRH
ncbi:hypothetical protein [Salininema proteolyticum]|uniref:Uncharacterized protein n=1 Tax=Salininema proteolyticum TaxID=1607685 RepID=A0ABV8TZ59_9ACTN